MKTKILSLGLICLLLLGPVLSAGEFNDFNPWQSLFTEPIETLYIIMEDRVAFTFSNQDENQVFLTIGTLEKKLRTPERNYKMKDIAVIIHNHLKDCKFSPTDYKQHRRLKKYGFRGRFLLYSHTTNKTYDMKKGDEKMIKEENYKELKILGKNIRMYRHLKNLLQPDLAEKIGMSKDYLSKIECGKQPNPGLKPLLVICQVLNIELFQLFMEDPESLFVKFMVDRKNLKSMQRLLDEVGKRVRISWKRDPEEPVFYHRENCECEKCKEKRGEK